MIHEQNEAEDIVQEAYLRAFKFFGGFCGGDSRAWLLTNRQKHCYTWLQQNRVLRLAEPIADKIVPDLNLDELRQFVQLLQEQNQVTS